MARRNGQNARAEPSAPPIDLMPEQILDDGNQQELWGPPPRYEEAIAGDTSAIPINRQTEITPITANGTPSTRLSPTNDRRLQKRISSICPRIKKGLSNIGWFIIQLLD